MADKTIFHNILIEQQQAHETRKKFYKSIEDIIGRPVISFFTSFKFPVMIEDGDSEMLEDVLRKMDLSNGLALIINSPGGIGLAAERIINVCKAYSKTGEFWAIIPNKAKSAATMIAFGASKIIMSKTSELGPIDPQVSFMKDNQAQRFSLWNIVQDYEELFTKATQAKGKNLQPYLQQLQNYDSKQIKEYKAAIALAEDIAIRALKNDMLKDNDEKSIKKKIEQFVNPNKTKDHGRAIYIEDAKLSELVIEEKDLKSDFWEQVYELYVRTNNYVNNQASKVVESKEVSFAVPLQK